MRVNKRGQSSHYSPLFFSFYQRLGFGTRGRLHSPRHHVSPRKGRRTNSLSASAPSAHMHMGLKKPGTTTCFEIAGNDMGAGLRQIM